MAYWNPWHGCRKISPGCANCYVFRIDSQHQRDASDVHKNSTFKLPISKKRSGEYKIPPSETVYTCFSSDFFLDTADTWRKEAWDMIKTRQDLNFFIVTKRIDRFFVELAPDWGDGYNNVTICCTCENQTMADFRLPIFLELPIKHKEIICEPLLENINLEKYLTPAIKSVSVGGESGKYARLCRYEWVLSIREQCLRQHTNFCFRQTGARFEKDGRTYIIPRNKQHKQAIKAGINLYF